VNAARRGQELKHSQIYFANRRTQAYIQREAWYRAYDVEANKEQLRRALDRRKSKMTMRRGHWLACITMFPTARTGVYSERMMAVVCGSHYVE
jgi:hypothetical protein